MATPALRDAVDDLRHAANHVDDTDVRTQIESLAEALEDADEWEQVGDRLHEVERKLGGLVDDVSDGDARDRLVSAREAVHSHDAYGA